MDNRMSKPTRRDILRYGGAAVGVVAAAPALVAFSSQKEATKAAKTVRKLTMAMSPLAQTGPTSFNALTGEGAATYQLVYSTLLRWNTKYTDYEPDLATSWSVSSDAKSYTFKLRPGVTWHDGQPFTSADVKFSFQLASNPDVAAWIFSYLPPIASIDTPDDHTVVVNLSEANSTLFSTACLLNMIPQHVLGGKTPASLVSDPYWYTSPIGTGPFKWASYQANQYATLSPFKQYWGGAPKLDQIVWVFYADAASSVIALEKETVNFDTLAISDLPTFQGNKKFKILGTPSGVTSFLWPNFRDSRFQSLAVRQAMMYAINREEIVKSLYKGGAEVVNGLFSNPNYISKSQTKYDYNPKKAKQLLKSANWDSIKGDPIEMVTYYDDTTSLNTMTVLQQMLKKVGMDVTIRSIDSATWAAEETTYKMAFVSLSNGPDPDVTRATFITGGNNNKLGNVSMPQLDSLYDKGRVTTGAARTAVYRDLNDAFAKNLPMIPLWVPERYAGITSNIKDFVWTAHPDAAYQNNAQKWTAGNAS